ncbi:unnamed protein product [Parnassius mnemosyne]|uniref:PiggyBac transposable element-derived protein domain-containing protein n=1 Tax=Parnassius mnemosyne TaxID=213953 RepID=A0AAV1LAS4_9NEOP
MFVRAGVSGIVYDAILYGGQYTFSGRDFSDYENTLGLGAKVVLSLCRTIRDPVLTVVYFDNYFSSVELMHHLRNELGILSIGTFRQNRTRGCILKDDKEMKKMPRGSVDMKVCEEKKIVLVKWFDNKGVLLGSNYTGVEPMGVCKRYFKDKKEYREIPCPNIVKEYNKHMGGVDLADMLVAIYRTIYKTNKWYMPIFSQLLDVAINNAWLLYRRECGLKTGVDDHIALKAFRFKVAQEMSSYIPKALAENVEPPNRVNQRRIISRPIATRPEAESRYDGKEHFPKITTKGRCRLRVKGKTTFLCIKCNMRLCIQQNRNCFYTFHQKEQET